MKNIYIFALLIFSLFLLIACNNSDPAVDNAENQNAEAPYNPKIHTLKSINLNNATILALKEREEPVTRQVQQSIAERCDELGKMDGVNYSALETTGKDNANLTPCFKNVHFWQDGINKTSIPSNTFEV